MKKDLLSLLDLERDDFERLFKRAIQFKKRYSRGIADRLLTGKTLGLIFDKKSTRTRIAFEAATIQLGGHPIYISSGDTQLSRNESAKDTARVLSRYIDCLAVRTFDHSLVEEFALNSTIPVINALTNLFHPCQILSDLMTIIEKKGRYKDVRIAWIGDGNNVSNSWVNAAGILGLDLVVACPDYYSVKKDIIDNACLKGNVLFTNDPREAVKGAEVVYTDVWASMGDEDGISEKIEAFKGFQVNRELLSEADDNVIVMHCLPAHRGKEIAEDVLEDENGIFWDQAENKRHMHKAILEDLILNKKN